MIVDIIIWLCCAGMAFCFIMLKRNNLIYKINTKAAEYIFSQPNWKELLKIYRKESYQQMLWSLKRWKFEDFYPKEWDNE